MRTIIHSRGMGMLRLLWVWFTIGVVHNNNLEFKVQLTHCVYMMLLNRLKYSTGNVRVSRRGGLLMVRGRSPMTPQRCWMMVGGCCTWEAQRRPEATRAMAWP